MLLEDFAYIASTLVMAHHMHALAFHDLDTFPFLPDVLFAVDSLNDVHGLSLASFLTPDRKVAFAKLLHVVRGHR